MDPPLSARQGTVLICDYYTKPSKGCKQNPRPLHCAQRCSVSTLSRGRALWGPSAEVRCRSASGPEACLWQSSRYPVAKKEARKSPHAQRATCHPHLHKPVSPSFVCAPHIVWHRTPYPYKTALMGASACPITDVAESVCSTIRLRRVFRACFY